MDGRPLLVAEKILECPAGTVAPWLTSPATTLFPALTLRDSGAMLTSRILPWLFPTMLDRMVVLIVIILLGPMDRPVLPLLASLPIRLPMVGTWAELLMSIMRLTLSIETLVLRSMPPNGAW